MTQFQSVLKKAKKSLHTDIFTTLRDRIVCMSYPPGTALNEKELCEEFGVSRTPLREAIRMLEDLNLVDVIPRFGTHVSSLDLNEIRCAMQIKVKLEALASEGAAENLTPQMLEKMELMLARFREQDAAIATAIVYALDEDGYPVEGEYADEPDHRHDDRASRHHADPEQMASVSHLPERRGAPRPDLARITTLTPRTYNEARKPDWSHLLPYYAQDIHFADSVQEIHGITAFREMVERLTHRSGELRMDILNAAMEDDIIFIEWEMTILFRKTRSSVVHGASRLRLDEQGKIAAQRDYYDLWGDIFDNIPGFGILYRRFMRKVFG